MRQNLIDSVKLFKTTMVYKSSWEIGFMILLLRCLMGREELKRIKEDKNGNKP